MVIRAEGVIFVVTKHAAYRLDQRLDIKKDDIKYLIKKAHHSVRLISAREGSSDRFG